MGRYFFFFNDTATTEIYTLSLHDALPIFGGLAALIASAFLLVLGHGHLRLAGRPLARLAALAAFGDLRLHLVDRKSTRLNSSHANISYAVFCLKKKNQHVSTSHTRLVSSP